MGDESGFHVHGLENLGRNRRLKVLLRGRGVIADAVPVAGFILHLDHDYRTLCIDFLQVRDNRQVETRAIPVRRPSPYSYYGPGYGYYPYYPYPYWGSYYGYGYGLGMGIGFGRGWGYGRRW